MSVVVVGGGVLGLMHAVEARRRGHDVGTWSGNPAGAGPAYATSAPNPRPEAVILG